MNEFAELCEDLVLSFRPLLVVELGEGAFLVCAVDLVLLAKTDGLHTTMSEERHKLGTTTIRGGYLEARSYVKTYDRFAKNI